MKYVQLGLLIYKILDILQKKLCLNLNVKVKTQYLS